MVPGRRVSSHALCGAHVRVSSTSKAAMTFNNITSTTWQYATTLQVPIDTPVVLYEHHVQSSRIYFVQHTSSHTDVQQYIIISYWRIHLPSIYRRSVLASSLTKRAGGCAGSTAREEESGALSSSSPRLATPSGRICIIQQQQQCCSSAAAVLRTRSMRLSCADDFDSSIATCAVCGWTITHFRMNQSKLYSPSKSGLALLTTVELRRGGGYGSLARRCEVVGGVWWVFCRKTGRIHPSSRNCAASRFLFSFSFFSFFLFLIWFDLFFFNKKK